MAPALIPTTVVGSYPQPRWLVDAAALHAAPVPRIRRPDFWRVPADHLEQAQDDATLLAIRDMEAAGIDVVTDGEIRRESYSNRFATALEGMDGQAPGPGGQAVPRITGPIRRTRAVEVRDMEFLRRATDRLAKITLPGPFSAFKQASNAYYRDEDEAVMDMAAAVNAEALALQAAGADLVQLDEPWVRVDPAGARRIAVSAIGRALAGVTVPTVVHLCFGYAAHVRGRKPAAYDFLAELAGSAAGQVSIECAQPGIDLGVLADLAPKTVVLGVLDLSDPHVETPELVCGRLQRALQYADASRLVAAPDCGMKYLPRDVAFGKLRALAAGAALARQSLG